MAGKQLKDEVANEIKKLTERFSKHRDEYVRKKTDFDESETRSIYLDPFFRALNWDINNVEGKSPALQEVRREKGPTTGEPDYTFRISSRSGAMTPAFFVEAKAPRENLHNMDHIYQARRYGYSASLDNLSVVMLTNFDRFLVYRADEAPTATDDRHSGLLYEWTFDNLAEHIDELIQFERNEVHAGSLGALARHTMPMDSRPPIESDFLNRLNAHRRIIAESVALALPSIQQDQLSSFTETLVNRFVFVRFAEDRGILPAEDMKAALNEWRRKKRTSLIKFLSKYFDRLDAQFNGRLFAYSELDDSVIISDDAVVNLIEDLYPPLCPYRFDLIRVELLGEIYEKYLGEKIDVVNGKVCVQEKPEVRHANGVYYTPGYIVEGILGAAVCPRLRACSSIEEIFKLRGIDPACGSGSFLLGLYRAVYDEVLRRAQTEDFNPRYIDVDHSGNARLNFSTKRRILEDCLYGIDVDSRAVRVAELSLYLKLLEDEPDVSKNPKPYLPKIERNLKSGNSLLDSEMIAKAKISDLSDGVADKLSLLTWERKDAFKDIMDTGGFDFIVGNPPYIRIQEMSAFAPVQASLIQQMYSTCCSGSCDVYVAFLERCAQKLKNGGSIGMIVSNKFMVTKYGAPIRQYLAENFRIKNIVDFDRGQVFRGATTHTCVLVAERNERGSLDKTAFRVVHSKPGPFAFTADVVGASVSDYEPVLRDLGAKVWVMGGVSTDSALPSPTKFKNLEEICIIFQGIRTSDDNVFVLTKTKFSPGKVIGFSRALKREVEIESTCVKAYLRGREIGRHVCASPTQALIFPYSPEDAYELVAWAEILKTTPLLAAYLKACRGKLLERQKGKYNQDHWYGYIYKKNHDAMAEPKLMMQSMAPCTHISYDATGKLFFATGYGIQARDRTLQCENFYAYLAAILKSATYHQFIIARAPRLKASYEYRKEVVRELPIPVYDESDSKHLELVRLQKDLIRLSKRCRDSRDDNEIAEHTARIEHLETKVDLVVASMHYSGPLLTAQAK